MERIRTVPAAEEPGIPALTLVYLSFFGLREAPFSITPDTSFLFPSEQFGAALDTLRVAVATGEGFIKITGEVGTGKTLLCRKLLRTLDASWVSAYIHNPDLEPRTLLRALSDELGARLEGDPNEHQLLKGLNLALLNFARQKRRVLVCLDEAQAMPIESLETLRLLTNLETEKRKLVQVVLFGQPELDDQLSQRAVRQLRQRITFQHVLSGLSREETGRYLSHRLEVAGYHGTPLFAAAAVSRLHRASRGIPRLVNILAHKSLMLLYGEGGSKVSVAHVRAAAADTPEARSPGRFRRWLSMARGRSTVAGWRAPG